MCDESMTCMWVMFWGFEGLSNYVGCYAGWVNAYGEGA